MEIVTVITFCLVSFEAAMESCLPAAEITYLLGE